VFITLCGSWQQHIPARTVQRASSLASHQLLE